MAEKASQNGGHFLLNSASTQFYLVANFLWTKIAIVGTDCHRGNVDFHPAHDEKILSLIKDGILSFSPIPALGQFCHHAQCRHRPSQLIKLATQLPHTKINLDTNFKEILAPQC